MTKVHSGVTRSRISGEAIEISGEKVYVENQSGQALFVQISGITVPISGETVIARVSGEKVYAEQQSGQAMAVMISGYTVPISGETVKISGETVIAKVSGEKVYAEQQSGQAMAVYISGYTVPISGEVVKVSGEMVEAHILSGEVVAKISGDTVVIASGPHVQISGQIVNICTPTGIIAKSIVIGAISGGIQFTSGLVVSMTARAAPWNSGDIYVGGSDLAAGWRPYSGMGMVLEPGDAQSLDIDNVNRMYAFAEVSGDVVLVFGVAK